METEAERKSGKKRKAKEYRIDIFPAWCKSCGICVAFCPRNCLEQNEEGSPAVTKPDLCTGCGWCEIHCPDFAISLREATNGREPQKEESE